MTRSALTAIILMLSIAFSLAGCGSQTEQPPETAGQPGGDPKAAAGDSAILVQIPAGASYVMTSNIEKAIGSAEMFLIDIGLGEALGIGVSRPGDGRGPRSDLLDMIRKELKLGEGFDPKGGAAFVVLDPGTVGIDLVKAMGKLEPGEARPKEEDMIAAILPGTVETLFADAKPTKEGDLTILTPNSKKIYAAQKGMYVVISPSKIVAKAVIDAKTSAASELSKDELAMVNSSEITLHANVAPYRPVIKMLLAEAKKELERELDPATAMGFGVYLMMGEAMIQQLDTTTLGVKMGQNDLNIDSICTAKAGSTMAKVFEAESDSTGGAKVLDSLPSLPYVWAMGVDGWLDNAALLDASKEFSKSMMGPDSPYKLDEKDVAAMEAMQAKVAGLVTGVQVVGGGAPTGKGVASLTYVIRCKDSAKYMEVFPESIALSNKMMAAAQTEPDAMKISMTYAKAVEKVDGKSVDVINISMTGMPGVKPDEMGGILKMFLGEETIRMLVAAPDDKTLVMTLGGSTETLKEAFKVAANKGPIPAMPSTTQAMRNLPKDSSIVSLFNAANLLDVVRTGMKAGGAPPEVLKDIPSLKYKIPIAFGAKAKGATLHTSLYTAKPLIKEAVQAGMAAYNQARQRAMDNRTRAMERMKEMERTAKEAESDRVKP
ncbi:MAG: hypothetical protein QGH94_13770, partial [Phycisphaerae bacterium]|nr:hypothetical protein [Phycisphaerae bacterium]